VLSKLLPPILLLTLSISAFSAQKAITDDGQVVILNSDRTWQFENSKANASPNASLNSKKFTKTGSQSFKVKASPTSMGVYIDPEKWSFSKDKDHSNRLSFRSKNSANSDLYGVLIPEAIEIEIEALAEIALDNARDIAPDTKIVTKEYRIVNGSKILYMEMEGTTKSIKFKYVGYYGSNKSGTVQLIVYSASSIINAKLPEIEEFLNGFVGN
jgi:hypothetical protein